jgi:hypothetical protein
MKYVIDGHDIYDSESQDKSISKKNRSHKEVKGISFQSLAIELISMRILSSQNIIVSVIVAEH